VLESAELERGLAEVRRRIEVASDRAGRRLEEVRLIGVTKTVPPGLVRRAADAGVTEFGENYVQELAAKREAAPDATWHFIGRLQRNKVPDVLNLTDVVQTLEPGRAADRLANLAAERGRKVLCLVEVDFTGTRVGVSPDESEPFIERLSDHPGLECRGLMTVAPLGEDPRRTFGALRELRDRLAKRFPAVTELSMGMSEDLEAAVEEGATMVRVGSAIFGPRP
jgi:pyridoxal phosphate enzyme (YggS family)